MRILIGLAAVLVLTVTWFMWERRSQRAKEGSAGAPFSQLTPPSTLTVPVLLSFPRADLRGLDTFSVQVPDTRANLAAWVKAIVLALSHPPNSSVVAAVPLNSEPTSVFLDAQQNLYIDFPPAITESDSAGVELETLTIKALVKSIGETLPNVEAVRILVDGKDRETLWGHCDIHRFFPIRPISGE